jgi:hypothetical protein
LLLGAFKPGMMLRRPNHSYVSLMYTQTRTRTATIKNPRLRLP